MLGFGTAVFFIMRTWSKWESAPVLISVESTDYPNSRIHFPAVSICNVNQASNETIVKLVQRPYRSVFFSNFIASRKAFANS